MKIHFRLAPLFLGLAFSAAVHAGSLDPACIAGTLAAYDDPIHPIACSVGILNFDDFSFSSSGTGGASLVNESQIEVTPVAFAGGGGFAFSLVSGQPFSVLNNQTATYLIDYRFVIDPGPVAAGADLGMDPPFGNVSIDQSYCLDGQFVGGVCSSGPAQTLHVDDTNPPTSWTTQKNFNPPGLNFGSVITTIFIDGRNSPNGAGFDSVSGATSVLPEPGTIVLTLGSLLAIGLRRRFKSQV